jgi:hypothetical protein
MQIGKTELIDAFSCLDKRCGNYLWKIGLIEIEHQFFGLINQMNEL